MSDSQAVAGTPGRGSILILGAAKSGTTALFYAIRNALTACHGLKVKGGFEPRDSETVETYLKTDDEVHLVKALLGPSSRWNKDITPWFDKKIIIYRDPRDNIVSRIVFMLTKFVHPSEKEKVAELVAVYQQKERDPESISILGMVRRISAIVDRRKMPESLRANALLPAAMAREHSSSYFMMPYEDLVTGRFEALGAYLGLDIDPSFEVEGKHSFVTRTKGSGDWKNWFLQEDIDFFVTPVADDFRLLGFDPDETANETKVIPAAGCSEYVLRQFDFMEDKRRINKKRKRDLARVEG